MFLLKDVTADYPETKQVVYFDKTLYIPVNVDYIATDLDGSILGYKHHPIAGDAYWMLDALDIHEEVELGYCSYQGNWKDSLMEVK